MPRKCSIGIGRTDVMCMCTVNTEMCTHEGVAHLVAGVRRLHHYLAHRLHIAVPFTRQKATLPICKETHEVPS